MNPKNQKRESHKTPSQVDSSDTDVLIEEHQTTENSNQTHSSEPKPKKQEMKTFIFNLQEKGGTGKSFLTVLQAYKEQNNERSLFADADASTKSTIRNLKFLENRKPLRIAEISLLDARGKIVRDKLLSIMEQMVKDLDYDNYYLDFGAPESQQFTELITKDLLPTDLKAFEEHLNVKFVFNIIVAGGTTFGSCTDYLKKLVDLLGDHFEVNIMANEAMFYNFEHLLDELNQFAKASGEKVNSVKRFGDFDISNETGKNILSNIEKGLGVENLSFTAKLKMNNELAKI